MPLPRLLKLGSFLDFPSENGSAQVFRLLRRRIIILMIVIAVVPLVTLATISSRQYRKVLSEEIVNPLLVLVNKTRHSVELFLAERLSAVSFVASSNSFEQLADESNLSRLFRVMKQEFGGFVDLGLVDENGVLVSYVGPYDMKDRDYSQQPWFQEVKHRGTFVSDVFMGFRRFPHMVMAVQRRADGKSWTLRATIDTHRLDDLIASMRLDPGSDGFLMNKNGVLQTATKSYGGVLDTFPLTLPAFSGEAKVIEETDAQGREILVAYTSFEHSPYVLVVVKPRGEVFRAWHTLKSEIFYLFLGAVCLILLVVFQLTGVLVDRLQESEQKREAALREMEHSHKLSSIGRLAAGVAHEINNPMAIINEKAGLMKDLMNGLTFERKERFVALTDAIINSVERCRLITHRLLGFARRMDARIEVLDLNAVLRETVGFLEKEALYRNIDIQLQLAENLPSIASDRGQLQQSFLNLLSNAFAAVRDGGRVALRTRDRGDDTVEVAIQDNGCGMSEEVLKHLFEPFFTTRERGVGTGLGLFITYGIIKRLGGRIEAESQEGQGTTMIVHLPRQDKASQTG